MTVLCHFTNQGMYPYNITAIMGSLNSPFDFNFHIQNYSYKPVGILARPGDEITLDYQFQVRIIMCISLSLKDICSYIQIFNLLVTTWRILCFMKMKLPPTAPLSLTKLLNCFTPIMILMLMPLANWHLRYSTH